MVIGGAQALFHELRLGRAPAAGLPLTLRTVPHDDPGVLERLESTDGDVPARRVTVYRPAAEPARSYPPGLPFVPDVPAFVTEFPETWSTPCVRWLVEGDGDAVFRRVVDASRSGGWIPAEGVGELMPFPGRRLVLRRGDEAWLVLRQHLDGGRAVVQLLGMV